MKKDKSTPNALIFAHAAGYSAPEQLNQRNRFLLTSVEPDSDLHFQRFRPFDEANLETDSPIIMEIGRVSPATADAGLLSALVRLTRSISSGPLARLRRSSPRLLRRELGRAFRVLGRQLPESKQPDISMAVVDQKRVGLASTGQASLLKLSRDGIAEVTPESGRAFAMSDNRIDDASPIVTDLGNHDRLVLASSGLAECLERQDFDDPNIRLASPHRLSRRLLELAKKRGLSSASVITACFAERVPIAVVEPAVQASKSRISIPLPTPVRQPAIAV